MNEYSDQMANVLRSMEIGIGPTSPGFSEAIVLLSSVENGADEQRIAGLLEFDPEFVATVGNRLRSAKIWEGDKLSLRAWKHWHGENGGMAFCLDVNIASGEMMVAKWEGDEPLYSLTPSGKKRAARMLGIKP